MWFVAIGAVVGYGVYKESKRKHLKRVKDSPKWQLSMVDDKGAGMTYLLQHLVIDLDGSLRSYGSTPTCPHKKLKGAITKAGIAEFGVTFKDDNYYRFSGKVAGPNRIAGNWNLAGKSFGQFELVMLNQQTCQVIRDTPQGQNYSDTYKINLNKELPRIQAVGIDEAGLYIISGEINKNLSFEMIIYYVGKFTLMLDGRLSSIVPTRSEGNWKNQATDTGTFVIQAVRDNPFVLPVKAVQPLPVGHPGCTYNMSTQPFNPQHMAPAGQINQTGIPARAPLSQAPCSNPKPHEAGNNYPNYPGEHVKGPPTPFG